MELFLTEEKRKAKGVRIMVRLSCEMTSCVVRLFFTHPAYIDTFFVLYFVRTIKMSLCRDPHS